MAVEDSSLLLWKFSTAKQAFKFLRTSDLEDADEDTLLDKIPDPVEYICGAFFGFGFGNESPMNPVQTKPIFEKSAKINLAKFADQKPPKSLLALKIGALFGKHRETLQSTFSKTLVQNKAGWLTRFPE